MARKEQEKKQNGEEEYKAWLTKARSVFKTFVHEFKLKRDEKVQKRLRKIEKNWDGFSAFYFVEGAPATNNQVENYYSTSLKTHRKIRLKAGNTNRID